MPKLIAYLIDHCAELYGDAVLRLYGAPGGLAVTPRPRSDSGADEEEESDSLNSLQESGGHSSANSSDARRDDDSSIDSLEREDSDESSSSGPRRTPRRSLVLTRIKAQQHQQPQANGTFNKSNKMSLSNLSRDSGLTLSDTQLYNHDDDHDATRREVSASVSPKPSQTPPAPNLHKTLTKSVPHHLDAVELENARNVTYSYGRSVGVSIDGSCHDVVRKRKHAGLFSEKEARHRTSGSPRTPPMTNRTSINTSANKGPHSAPTPQRQGRGNCANIVLHKAEVHHRPLNSARSYAAGIDQADRVNENIGTPSGARSAGHQYRYRRPPLTALLSAPNLRRTASEESLPSKDQNGSFDVNCNTSRPNASIEPMSLPYVMPLTPPSSADNTPTTPQSSDAPRIASICSSSSETTQRSVKSSLSSCSIRSNPLAASPPSYQEAMNRKEKLARLHNNLSMSSRALNQPNIYEQSLRVCANKTLRAVPVRVGVDAQMNQPGSAVVHVPSGDVTCRVERPQHLNLDVVDGRMPVNGQVAVETRCAKDTMEDWRKDIHWSVAHLRTLFNGQRVQSQSPHRPVAPSRSVLVKPNYLDRIDGRYKKSLVCRSSLDLSVTSGHATNNNSFAVSNKNTSSSPGKDVGGNCVTVIHVTSPSTPKPLTIHSRCDSMSSGGEESYV